MVSCNSYVQLNKSVKENTKHNGCIERTAKGAFIFPFLNVKIYNGRQAWSALEPKLSIISAATNSIIYARVYIWFKSVCDFHDVWVHNSTPFRCCNVTSWLNTREDYITFHFLKLYYTLLTFITLYKLNIMNAWHLKITKLSILHSNVCCNLKKSFTFSMKLFWINI